MRDMRLFEILNVLAALKPADEVDAILRAHPDVAEAAKIYPLGMETMMEQALAAQKDASRGVRGGGFIIGGGAGERRLMDAGLKALRGDPSAVPDFMAEALRLFRQDKDADNPNWAPLPFWPSCRAYQKAMYWAGKLSGISSAGLLDEIPDTDLALLSSIELAAGVLGLAECGGMRMHRPSGRRR